MAFGVLQNSKYESLSLLSRSLITPSQIIIFQQEMAKFKGVVPGRGVGDSHMKGAGMLVVSLRGVNFGFLSHFGCSGQNSITFSREGFV